jgi:hypothetical protein
MPIDGRARVLRMEFGVGDLLLRYDFFDLRNKISSRAISYKYVVDLEILFCQMCSGLSLIWNRIQLTWAKESTRCTVDTILSF